MKVWELEKLWRLRESSFILSRSIKFLSRIDIKDTSALFSLKSCNISVLNMTASQYVIITESKIFFLYLRFFSFYSTTEVSLINHSFALKTRHSSDLSGL